MRGSVVAGVLSAGLFAGSALAQDAVQWRIEDGGNGHWYRYARDMSIEWHAAASAATASGGLLACVTTPDENAFVFAYLNAAAAWTDVRGPFLGGYQHRDSPQYAEPSGGWRWVSGEPWIEANWSTYGMGEPNNDVGVEDVLAMDNRGGLSVWNDVALNGFAGGQSSSYRTSTGYLIEWSADCNSDGIVDFGQIRAGELEDTNANNLPDCCEQGVACNCPADIDGSGTIDAIDLAIVIGYWGTDGGKDYPQADIDGSGDIDGADLATLLGSWGACE